MEPAACHVCADATFCRVPVGDGVVPICSEACAESFGHELRLVVAFDTWLAAFPSELEHGDPVHGERDGLLARFRRGEWRSVLIPRPRSAAVKHHPFMENDEGEDTHDGDPSNMRLRAGYLAGMAMNLEGHDRRMLRRAARSLALAANAVIPTEWVSP